MRIFNWSVLTALLLSCAAHAACPQSHSTLNLGEKAPWSALTAFTINEQATQAFASAIDGTVIAWDVESGRASVLIDCNKYRVSALSFAVQKSLLAIGDEEGILHLLFLSSAPPEIVQQLAGGWIQQVLFGPSLNSVLIVHRHSIDLWRPFSQKLIWSKRTNQELARAAISPDGKLVAVSTGVGIFLWDFRTATPIKDIGLEGDTGFVSDVAFTPDGRGLVAAVGSNVDIFDVATGRKSKTMIGHTDSVIAVTVLGDGKQLISVGEDHTLREWNLNSGALLSTWNVTPGYVTSNGKYLINSGSHSGELEIWDIQLRKKLQVLTYASPLTADQVRAGAAAANITNGTGSPVPRASLYPPRAASLVTGTHCCPVKTRRESVGWRFQ